MNFSDEEQIRTDNVPTPEQSPYVSPIPVIPQLFVALGLLVVVFGVTYIGVATSFTKSNPADEVRIEQRVVETTSAPSLYVEDFYENMVLEAKSAIVWDVVNETVVFNKHADLRLPLASVTKLMTALVASELLESSDTVAISLDALLTEGDSGFRDGEEFTVQDLIDLTLITSSNDGAAALSTAAGALIDSNNPEGVFVRAMNVRAQELGLTNTEFYNSTGLDISDTEAGAYGSARDMAHLMAHIVNIARDSVALTNSDEIRVNNRDGSYHVAHNTNGFVNNIDGLIASKTGYTELAGGNLVIAFNASLNRPIVIAVLGSSYAGRFEDTQKLVEKTRQLISNE